MSFLLTLVDSYANQGSRNSAILPFTSALSAFCAAATAAMVELPFIDAVSAAYGTIGEGMLSGFSFHFSVRIMVISNLLHVFCLSIINV